MRLSMVLKQKRNIGALAGFTAVALTAALGLTVVQPADATPGVVIVVAADGKATPNNCNSETATPYATIGSAITASAAGDTVKVCPGEYDEDVVIDKALTLKGAKAGQDVRGRDFGTANESTVTGLVTIQAADVVLDGFSLTNPNQGLGVLVKSTANDAVVRNNMVQTVGSNTFVGPTVGVYLELGPDNVTIKGNWIADVQSQTGSAQGILVGDSTSANPSLNTRIDRNVLTDIKSVNKGAYGIQLNNGASAVSTATGYTEAKVSHNTVKNLNGNWVHAIGLEGETPNVVVDHNTISMLTDNNPVPIADVVGVYFESNVFFFTGEVNRNSFGIDSTGYGIAVAPALTGVYPSLSVDGTCNWWGAKSGPSAIASGAGAKVGPGVDYDAFLKNANTNRDCGGDS